MFKDKITILKERGFPESLSAAEKTEGRRLYLKFGLLNGISVACLLESILILYAISIGITAPAVAVLASFIHLTMPFMLAGKVAVSHIGLARTWALGWFLRYVSAILMIIAPVTGRTPEAVTLLVMAGAFGFALFRSIGSISTTPLAGEITSPDHRGIFLSSFAMKVNITHLASMLAIVLILMYSENILTYQLIFTAGCIIGLYATKLISRIPESSAPRISAQKPLLESLAGIWRFEKTRKLLFGWCSGFSAFTLVIPFTIIAMKNGYGISDFMALAFSAFLLAGGILSSIINRLIADKTGPRSLLILYMGGLFIVAAFWSFAPPYFLIVPTLLSLFIAGFCKIGIIICLGHSFLNIVEDYERVGNILIMRILSGLAAGISGSLVGGGILHLLGVLNLEGLHLYRIYFRVMLPGILLLIAVIRQIKPGGDWPVRRVLGLLFPPREI